MGFIDTLKGVVIAFVGGILILLGLGIIVLPSFLAMYGFPDLGSLSIPIAIVLIVFGLAILIYGQKMAGIR